MRTLLGLFSFVILAWPALGEADAWDDLLNDIDSVVTEVSGVVSDVDGMVSGVNEVVEAIDGSSTTTTTTTTTSAEGATGLFNPETVFPAWGDGGEVTGVIGSNQGALNQGESRLIVYFIPKIIELMIWLLAPVVTVLFMYSGLQFVWGGDREEEVTKARTFFRSAVLGLTFIVLSYSLMKAVFFILAI